MKKIAIFLLCALFSLVSYASEVYFLYSPPDSNNTASSWLSEPENITTEIEYNPISNEYIIIKKIGSLVIDRQVLSFEEYQNYDMDKMISNYWKNRSTSANASASNEGVLTSLIPQLRVNSELFETIFGGQTIDIRPSGSAELTFAIVNNKRADLSIPENQRSVTRFDFNENIQLNATAKIGEAISFNLNYNTGATFSFENELKLKYEGKEDNIIQSIEAGNISFPLPTTLIAGSQTLWGVKTKLKFGKLLIDAVFSEQKSEASTLTVQGGAERNKFNFKADDYDDNRHYFLAQYFYNNYNQALSTLPVINSKINIIKIEVWRTNIGSAVTENRNLVAFADLGEKKPYGQNPFIENPAGSTLPDESSSNNLLNMVDKASIRNINNVSSTLQSKGFISGENYEKIESARKLSSSEYTFNSKLGFISLNQALTNDQVLAVAFKYQIVGDSTVYQVGEFSDEGITDPNVLVVKLLKSSSLNVRNPMWKLMMKNVYPLNAYQISRDNFRLNVLYKGDDEGVATGYFTQGSKKGIPLIQLLGLDRMDNQQNAIPDGVFDWIDNASVGGGTIVADRGLIFFPYVEPFGKDLRAILGDEDMAQRYCYDSLYTLTISQAQQYPDKDKFYLEGTYESSSSGEISLNATNVPQGSVKVMAGGITLIEGVDYTVDYAMGRVKIINQGYLSSGTPITISTESQTLFSTTTKRMFGMRASYEINKDFNVGATLINLHESPITTKVNYGEEPMNNTLWGVDFNLKQDVNFITKLIDWLPFYSTKTPSSMNLTGEFAQFIPGNPSVIGSSGTSYIDDFEAAKTTIDLKAINSWFLASTPQDYNTANPLFPETAKNLGWEYGFNRAKIAWYRIDDIFYSSQAPSNITKDDRSQPYARQIFEREVYPNKEIASGQPTNITEFNVAFYPSERGPYNYDTTSAYSAGIADNGLLLAPQSRWGGIMRKLESTDFEAANIEYIEFWLMDPFIGNETAKGGKLYFNLGDISEDILRDGRKSFENGLPTSAAVVNVDTTIWGRVPTLQAIVNAFDNNEASRPYQDIGYDGLSSTDEQSFFNRFLQIEQGHLNADAYASLSSDPSADDFRYFRSTYYDNANTKINDRYKYYNNSEGNSSIANGDNLYPTQQTSLPNVEDINQDNTLSESENYYEYSIELSPDKMVVGNNYITDIQNAENVALANGSYTSCKWYQFKIPIRVPEKTVGSIQGYQSLRFIRMFLRDFEEPVILRFAALQLVSGDWRKYSDNLLTPGFYPTGTQTDNTTFTVASVSIEENGKRAPIPYALPPGIDREKMYSTTSYQQMNEQALSMKVTDLSDGDARAIYKTATPGLDMRQYKKLKMFVHAEKVLEKDAYKKGDVSLFVRLGSDFTSNYYEYELPLTFTPWYTSASQNDVIWPEANNIEIGLEDIVKVKENRNKKVRSGDITVSSALPYSEIINGRKVTVLGSPSISDVAVMMIGVRNPKKTTTSDDDNMLPKSVEVWINELRLTDFNRSAGWAVTGSMRTNLADLGDLSMSGTYRSAGFGTLEQSISKISQDNVGSFDIATNVELGKFFPKKSGIKLPMHFDYSRTVSNPRYNPLDPDVLLKDDLLTYKTQKEKDSIKHMVQDFTSNTNINFMNVRKEKTDQTNKQHIWDIENFNASYSYSNTFNRDVDIEYNNKTQQRGGLNYNYSFRSKALKPFSNIPLFKAKAFAIIKDFSLYYTPRSWTFGTEMVRDFEETKLRSKSQGIVIMEPYYYKQFYWNRNYSLNYDITQNLKLRYTASMNARIDEPYGKIDTRQKKDSVIDNILDLGRAQSYNQKTDLSWNIPINKLPYLDWVRLNTTYSATYKFTGSTQALVSLGNTIENNSMKSVNANFSLTTIYNKIPLIRKALELNQDSKKASTPKKPKRIGKDGKPIKEKEVIVDSTSVFTKVMKQVGYYSTKLLTSVKTVSINYSVNEGTYIPGFMPVSKWLGMSTTDDFAPGFGFVFGSQKNIMPDAISKGWLSKDTLMTNAFNRKTNKSLNGQISMEPLTEWKINLKFSRTQSEQYIAYYQYNATSQTVQGPLSPSTTGNFSISTITIATMFQSMDKDNITQVFKTFLSNRHTIAQRLADGNPNYNGQMILDSNSQEYYPDGYGPTSQQVLIPSFLAAYTGTNVNSRSLNPFTKIPLPNWQIEYTGLANLEIFKQWVNSITISNAYSSNYNIGSFASDVAVPINNPNYDYGTEWIRNTINNNYIARYTIDQISIIESFSPLFKMDVNLKNSFQANFEVQKNRSLSLSFSNDQLTEINRLAYTIGGGYRFKDVRVNIRAGSIGKELKSDIDLKASVTWNKNTTILRKIDQDVNLMSAGSDIWTANLSGEYAITEKILLTAFFEMTINNPYISNSYKNSTTQGGFKLRLTL